jgi:hypothetical protein
LTLRIAGVDAVDLFNMAPSPRDGHGSRRLEFVD